MPLLHSLRNRPSTDVMAAAVKSVMLARDGDAKAQRRRGKGCHVPLDVDESGAGFSKIVETKAASKPSFS